MSYNRLFTREIVIIEGYFGQLKHCFLILRHKIPVKIGKVPSLVISCFILYNLVKHLIDEVFHNHLPEQGEQEELENQNAVDYPDTVTCQRVQLRRDALPRLVNGFGVQVSVVEGHKYKYLSQKMIFTNKIINNFEMVTQQEFDNSTGIEVTSMKYY